MRIDKYLKVSRLIKRRTIAKEVTSKGRVMINDKVAKAGSVVTAGDIITIQFGQRTIKVEVLSIQEHAKKEQASEMFKVLSEEKIPSDW